MMWFVGCVRDEGTITVLGPFLDHDLAVEECLPDCAAAHLIGTRVGPTVALQAPSECVISWFNEPPECLEYRLDHNERCELLLANQPEFRGDMDLTPAFEEAT